MKLYNIDTYVQAAQYSKFIDLQADFQKTQMSAYNEASILGCF